MRAEDCEKALARRYGAPEQALFFNVPCNTGGGADRLADAVAMELWPSRGLALHAFEIKVNRYDWTRNELKNPAKAEKFFALCDYFWMVTPEGIIQEGELPDGWGHIIVNADLSTTIKVKAVRKEEKNDTVCRSFLASLLRSAHGQSEKLARQMIDDKVKAAETRAREEMDRELKRRTPEAYQDLLQRYNRLLVLLGYDPEDPQEAWWSRDSVESLVSFHKMFKKLGVAGYGFTVENLLKTLRETHDKMVDAMKEFDPLTHDSLERLQKKGKKP